MPIIFRLKAVSIISRRKTFYRQIIPNPKFKRKAFVDIDRHPYKMQARMQPLKISILREHSFSTLVKFPEKLTFLTPDKHICKCVSGGGKCYFFGTFCKHIK